MCDFECLTYEPTRVWLWASCNIDNVEEVQYGTTIDSWFRSAMNKKKIYFHNLKYDGAFILYYLMYELNFECNDSKENGTFKTLISDKNVWFAITIYYDNKCLTIHDSYKKLPFSVKSISKAFQLPMAKGEIDLFKRREEGYTPTDEELEYVINDVKIVALALKEGFKQGLYSMTAPSDAMKNYKKVVGKYFKYSFPVLSLKVDEFIRASYRGGYTYLKPEWAGVDITEVTNVYDVNSLYPYAMYTFPMPYGNPIEFKGMYKPDKNYPLYVIRFIADFKLRDGFLPTVQIKNSPLHQTTKYVTDSKGLQELTMTSVDFELFMKHYHVYEIQYIGGYKFKQTCNMFKDYIDYWMKIKIESDGAIKQLAKLMLNSLYGKFAKNPDTTQKFPTKLDGKVKLITGQKELSDPIYIPVGSFITSYARRVTINAGQINFDKVIYFDTDSMHMIGVAEGIEVDSSKLGAWKHESSPTRSRFLKPKQYIEEIDGELEVKCAGMTNESKTQVTWFNFKHGAKFKRTKQFMASGGCIIKEEDYNFY